MAGVGVSQRWAETEMERETASAERKMVEWCIVRWGKYGKKIRSGLEGVWTRDEATI